ncbi:hypothetical protein SeMB42_g07689 [Synchytrium endobioticum]|uniref:Uncharacterized protein n=1 Tax=Synchytrium endobioticum TaxID=286115 RepID=A0A507BPJ9_9FUNG|nr:hypothetical protein SeMB42_g07689 [Synchytrium endobioticum]TPX39986.1 hypothetical protein SeLEV6574_g06873 [Synchytrium endobioticum]
MSDQPASSSSDTPSRFKAAEEAQQWVIESDAILRRLLMALTRMSVCGKRERVTIHARSHSNPKSFSSFKRWKEKL